MGVRSAPPGALTLGRGAVDQNAFEPPHAAAQEILALDLAPQDRAYALLLNGEAYRREGQGSEARGQFELVRDTQRGTPLGWTAALRLAQMDVEAREFSRAAGESAEILKQPLPYDVRALALLLHAEAAYRARDWDACAAGFRRFLSEFPGHPQAGAAALSLGWAELRRGNGAAARERWVAFARFFPADPRAPEALLLAAELAGGAGGGGATGASPPGPPGGGGAGVQGGAPAGRRRPGSPRRGERPPRPPPLGRGR